MTTRKNQTPTLPILDAVDSLMSQIRKRFPEVPEMTIVLGSSGYSKKGLKLGHFAADTWSDENTKHELLISGEALSGGAEKVLGVLLHESSHAIAHVNGIQDTSNNNRYHNKRFKIIAEALGLTLTNVPTHGWTGDTLTDGTADLYNLTGLAKALTTYRKRHASADDNANAPQPKERNRTKVLVDCRDCESPVTVSKIWFESATMICGNCETEFQIVEGE